MRNELTWAFCRAWGHHADVARQSSASRVGGGCARAATVTSVTAYHADASDLADKEVLTWDAFGVAGRELAQTIVDSGFEPEIVIAVARGGLIPAGHLAYALGLKLADAINVEFYTDVHETLPDPVLLAPLLDTDAIKDRRVLVVDDVADSGRTLALVLELLRGMGAEARSAVLYLKSASVVAPDYTWRRTDDWIVFPWSALPPVSAA
jgi:hypoxanthine phosphoribosyltransferase